MAFLLPVHHLSPASTVQADPSLCMACFEVCRRPDDLLHCRSVFSMPETAIGFFPDVGASSFLSRAPCGLGALLALSGRRLRGREMLWAGLATHYVPSHCLPALEDALKAEFSSGSVSASGAQNRGAMHGPESSSDGDSLHTINRILNAFQEVRWPLPNPHRQQLPAGCSYKRPCLFECLCVSSLSIRDKESQHLNVLRLAYP